MLWLPNLITLNDGAAAVMIMETSAVSFWVIKFVLTIVVTVSTGFQTLVVTIEVQLHSVRCFCNTCSFMTSIDVNATALECVVPCLIDTVNLVSWGARGL